MDSNPYAPPQTSIEPYGAGGALNAWRLEGDLLIAQKGARLPDICVYSGEPSNHRIKKKLTWAPPWIFAVMVLSWLIGLIIFFIVRKSGELDYALGEAGRKRRKTGGLLLGLSFVVLILGLVGGGAAEAPALLIVGFLGFFVMLIVGAVMMGTFRITRIDELQIYIKLKPPAAQAFARVQG